MNVAALLHRRAELHPERPAIVDGRFGRRQVTTFAALDEAAGRAAALLRSRGLGAGDTVLVFQPMSPELYVALAALFRLGATAMFVDPSAGSAHIAQCCAIRPPDGLIATTRAHLLRLTIPAVRRIPHRFAIGPPVPGAVTWRRIQTFAPASHIAPRSSDDPALLTFTSGSTGAPKAAVRTHGFLRAQHTALARSLAYADGESDLTTLPVFLLANLASGLTSILPNADLRRPGAVRPGPLLDQLEAERPDRVTASPAFLERLAKACESQGRTLPFRRVYTGGAPVFPGLLKRLQRVLPDGEVHVLYGSTEAEPIAHTGVSDVQPEDWAGMREGHGLLVGRPVEEIALRILPDRWGTPIGPYTEAALDAEAMPPDTPGEIVVRGAHVLPGYLGGEGDAETKFDVDGVRWHRTGDAGYLDPQGRLWLLGRCSATIRDERGTLYPFSVESAALQLPGVARCALLGLDGRRVLAVEPDAFLPDPEPDAVRAALDWAALDVVRLVRRIPLDRRHNAKVDYPALRKLLARG